MKKVKETLAEGLIWGLALLPIFMVFLYFAAIIAIVVGLAYALWSYVL